MPVFKLVASQFMVIDSAANFSLLGKTGYILNVQLNKQRTNIVAKFVFSPFLESFFWYVTANLRPPKNEPLSFVIFKNKKITVIENKYNHKTI